MSLPHVRLTGARKPFAALLCCAVICAGALQTAGAAAPAQSVPLSALESKIPQAPGVLADEAQIEAATEALRVERDKAGMQYTFSGSFGPAAIIVPRAPDDHVLRYQQQFGVSFPLAGAHINEKMSILDAQVRVQLARIAFAQARRERLSLLREAYVEYWQYVNQNAAAQEYLGAANADISKAKALRRSGFWTSTSLLDFLNSVQKVHTEAINFQSAGRAAVAHVDAAVGAELPVFRPSTPDFYAACVPNREEAIDSAYRADATIAQLDAEALQYATELGYVKLSSIDAYANGQAGSTTDINHRVSGYDLQAALSVSFPKHARDEERGKRAEYLAEIQSLQLQRSQRALEINSSIDALLDDVKSAQDTLMQALQDEAARRQDLQKALVRYKTVSQSGATAFEDVHTQRDELYAAEKASAEARGNVLLQANQLLLLAPGACGASYEAMPVMTLNVKPSPTPTPKH